MRVRSLVLLVAAAVGLIGSAAAAAQVLDVSHRSAGLPVRAVDAATGRTLDGSEPLRGGRQVDVHLAGYAPGAAISVALVGVRSLAGTIADPRGRVVYRYALPSSLPAGRHVLIFSGAAGHAVSAPGGGNVVVSMPLAQFWRFRTGSSGGTSAPASAPASGPGAPGSSGSSAAGAGHGTRGGGTSSTGTDALAALVIGLAALVAGGALVLTTRRRRPTPRRG